MIFILRNDNVRDVALGYISTLDLTKPMKVTVEPYSKRRSLNQNAFLHAVPLKLISEHTGYEIEELKEYLLGEAFGWQTKRLLNRDVSRPVKTSSELNTEEFNWFLDWIERWASETLGMILPKPNEVVT